jgi:hypothetical protein
MRASGPFLFGTDLRRTTLPRTRVNKGKRASPDLEEPRPFVAVRNTCNICGMVGLRAEVLGRLG